MRLAEKLDWKGLNQFSLPYEFEPHHNTERFFIKHKVKESIKLTTDALWR
jgi:hypothetical protein